MFDFFFLSKKVFVSAQIIFKRRSAKLLRSVRAVKGAQEMLRCLRPPSPPFYFVSSLSPLCTFQFVEALPPLSLSLLQVTSVSLCVCGYVRNECVAPMSVYIVRRQLELGEAAKGSRRPPLTPPRSRVVSRAWGDSPPLSSPSLPPSIPLLCSTSFSSWRTPLHPLPPASQKEG